MMEQAIKDFAKQFAFKAKAENGAVPTAHRAVVLGMGGSHLAADLLRVWKPDLQLTVHADYGLPALPEHELRDRLIIASSYSGNTEEVLDGYDAARKRGLPLVAIAVGGELLERAQRDGVPFIRLPDAGLQPRMALGFSMKATMYALDLMDGLTEVSKLATSLDPASFEERGKELAGLFAGKVPVVYASTSNGPIAYNWKIKLNETGKVPAFMNVVPELNHNEMNGFDEAVGLKEPFQWIFLTDSTDHPRIQKRMSVLEEQLTKRGLVVVRQPLVGNDVFTKIFSSLLTADWCAVHLAAHYGHEAEQVPMIEEFKKRMAA